MKIKEVKLNNFKRFTDLTITNLSEKAKLVVVIGPNGSGKTALFDAFNHWYRITSGISHGEDHVYFRKDEGRAFNWKRDENVKITLHGIDNYKAEIIEKSMYFRTAYRNEPDFAINSLSRMKIPYKYMKIQKFIQNDQSVSDNYRRLISNTISGVYDLSNDNKTVKDLRERLIGSIRNSMKSVFDDLVLQNIGEPLDEGAFYFKKGTVKRFHYKNLSGGEKSAFDILLDIIIKKEYYPEAIYCIDEPEAHMHTELQGKLLEETFNLIPEEGQLWINTHSLGMMRKARELMQNNPGTVEFLDFNEVEFDEKCVLSPVCVDKTIWEKFLSVALEDIDDLVKPQCIILCEGNKQGRKFKNFDAQCFSRIFDKKHPDVTFVSAGSCTDLEKDGNIAYLILKEILPRTKIFRLVDRDDKSPEEIQECLKREIKVLGRRHMESYLFDPEILGILFQKFGHTDEEQSKKLKTELLKMVDGKIQESVARGNAKDDIKSPAGSIFVEIKKMLNLTQCGNTLDAFMRDSLVPLVTQETEIFKELEKSIFN